MRVLTLYRHGFSMGTAPQKNTHKRAKRSTVGGWSESSTRRNTAFLRSIDERKLPTCEEGKPLVAVAFTLTVRDCPETSDEWHRIRRAFYDRLRRMGLVRSHWVTEWQRRGVPHLHGAFWFEEGKVIPAMIVEHWCKLTEHLGTTPRGQHFAAITDAIGWFQYLSKHASRGVKHYQRSPENVPKEWKSKTGRMWGHTGDWPIMEGVKFSLDDEAFFAFRRIVKNWRLADSRTEVQKQVNRILSTSAAMTPKQAFRSSSARHRVRAAKTMLKCTDEHLSNVRGVSEWVSEESQFLIIDHLRAQGYNIEC